VPNHPSRHNKKEKEKRKREEKKKASAYISDLWPKLTE